MTTPTIQWSEFTVFEGFCTYSHGIILNFQIPSNEEEWKKVACDYDKIWNFPHCVGAMDGKHVVIESPIVSANFIITKEHLVLFYSV